MRKLRLTHPQRRIVDVEMLSNGTSVNNIPIYILFPKGEEVLLKKAVEKVLAQVKDIHLRLTLTAEGEFETYYGNDEANTENDQIQIVDLRGKTKESQTEYIDDFLLLPFGDILDKKLYEFRIVLTDSHTVLCIRAHHLVCDGTASSKLREYIVKTFASIKTGNEYQVPPNNYLRYSDIEDEYLEGEECAADKSYWLNHLADLSECPDGMADSGEFDSKAIDIELSAKTISDLRNYTHSFAKPISPFVFTLGLLNIFISRYYNAKSVLLTTGFHNRMYDDEVNNSIGMLVSTVPLKLEYDENSTITKVMENAKSELKQSLTHSRYPYNLLLTDLNNSGVDVKKLLNFAIVSNSYDENEEFAINSSKLNASYSPLLVRVNMSKDDKHGLQALRLEFRRDCFNEKEMEVIASCIHSMIKDIAQNPNKTCNKISFISKEEKQRILKISEGEVLDYDRKATLISLFKEQVNIKPEGIAIVDEIGKLSYREAEDYSDKLAKHLIHLGTGSNPFVCIMMPRRKEFMVSVLGIMKAGCAYIPIDTEYPQDRIDHMLTDSGAQVLITTKALSREKGVSAEKIVYIEEFDFEKENDEQKELTLIPPKPEDLAYMIYTSGSTGKPKGVKISHESLVALTTWTVKEYNIKSGDKICCYCSLSFDASVIDLFPPLTVGGEAHIISEELRFDLNGFNRYLTENKIFGGTMSTQVGMEYLNQFETSLNYLMLGGEKIIPVKKTNAKLYNGYGPTEFTVCSSFHLIDQSIQYDNIPIGRPVPNSWNYVVDRHYNLLPIGMAGELCLSGIQISQGYHDRNELTNEKFIDNPFKTCKENEKMYRTGDLVRWNEDGELEFLGRIDTQVKLRGFRIELGEIESVIAKFEGITACTVDIRAIGHVQHICAYYTTEKDIDIENLKQYLQKGLAEYMVPTAFIMLEKMPLTPNGKINKKALPDPVIEQGMAVKPRDEKEQRIFDLVSEVVGNESFGVTDDLFTVGLTSLMAIKVAVLLKNKLGLQIATSEILKGKTIEYIAIKSTMGQDSVEKLTEKRAYYPLTQNQLGVYFDCAKQPGTLKYNIPAALFVAADIDAQKLADALTMVIEAHPYLKTNLAMHGQTMKQVRQDEREVCVPVYSVSESELKQAKDNFVKPFDLFKGPLFRAAVYKTPKSVYLLLDFHHLIFDGGSMDILLKELERAYEGEKIGQDVFTAYELALLEAQAANSEAYLKAQDYFKQKLKDCDGPTEISADLNGDEASGRLKEQIAVIDKKIVRDFCKKVGITPSSFFLAGASYAASRFAGSKTLLLSTLDNGRGTADNANILGMLVKTLPLVLTVDSTLPILEYVRKVQSSVFETMENSSYPLTRIAEEYHFSPQIMYAFQGGVINEYQIGGHQAIVESLELKTPKFKLSVHIEESEKHYKVCAQYNDALYSPALMETLADGVILAIEWMMSDQAGPIGKVSLLSKEQSLMIQNFNKTSETNQVRVLHKMFEEQVRQKGDQTALIARDGVYTYSKLNAHANRIANALIQKGLKVEDRVAFMLPRDGRMIATMLGILKAGGAYIPIDPDYPPERIKHILEDSSARFIISCNEKPVDCDAQQLFVESLLTEMNETNPQVDVKPENLSYIIYTSGSTGKPKGVMLEHKGIANYVAPTYKNIHVRPLVESAKKMVSVTTVSFDMFLKESFTMLMNGLVLVLADENQANNPMELAELFKATGADAFNATPSRMLQYLEAPAFTDAIAQCKVVMAGAEPYPVNLLQKLKNITKARLINTYGPTEITVSSNAKELEEVPITVGRPLANVKEFIMDTDGNPLPIGIVGELWIGGEGVGRGYWGNEELTARSFVETPGGRFYKSGDLAKWNEKGEVIILGRNDNQVKLRGLRIELGEIQTAICKYTGIKSAVVIIGKVRGVDHICAYYTADLPVSSEKLRDNLKDSLTKYMIPTAYKQLTSFPVTPNGKINLKALPEPDLMARQDYVAPTNEIEKSFCEIYAQVLNIDEPGIEDDFFDLGGTSLLVTKVTIEAMNRGYNISYGDVFTHPTPREIASLLSTDQNENTEQSQSEGEKIGEYDYSTIEKLLKQNTLEAYLNGEKQKLGNVLLTGATGFLGIHILKEFIENEDGMIYCFIRAGKQASLEKRLKSMLVYYFEDSYDELFGKRIFPVEGDITKAVDFDRIKNLPIDTVINCAANVKHFAHSEEIERINVNGVQNGIDFCKEKGCQFIQISTASVAGISINGNPPEDIVMDETMLYFGQDIENKYIGSKFRAERLVLQAVANGLNGKIMRVGNLMGRNKDGEFQINFNTNGFVNRLRAYQAIRKIAFSTLGMSTEFAPIDSTAQAILKLACTPRKCCVFHPYNDHSIYIGDVIEVMNKKGMTIEAVEACDFEKYLSEAMRDKSKAEALSGLIAYLNLGRGKRVYMLSSSNHYTMQVLYRKGFKWPLTTDEYLDRFISLLMGLGFFMEDEIDV